MAYGYGGTRQSEAPMKSQKAKTSPKPATAKKVTSKGMTDKQKTALDTHMKGLGLKGKQRASHRRRMTSRMNKGMTLSQAHQDIK